VVSVAEASLFSISDDDDDAPVLGWVRSFTESYSSDTDNSAVSD